ncbi:MAG: PPC domain-containing protein [Planctomycetaceae bacterium]|nr:PPC domain-containing protein [Planctomycetaceae bacterium]
MLRCCSFRLLLTVSAASLLYFACAAVPVQAQTAWPMLMSLEPVAAQAGQTSEHTVHSRYSMFGASGVVVSGSGITGEVVTEMKEVKEGEKPPNLTKVQVRFTVAADALPGVRDFRLITPSGPTTLGQLVVSREKVLLEQPKNNTMETAAEVTVPATLCGALEAAEDVDFFRFAAKAGQRMTFHVMCMRLQDRIHDLQAHADPIIALRGPSGSTLAQSDNHFAADPLLSYTFERDGEYFLEIRDVRYAGNAYWQYSVNVTDGPFVTAVLPMTVSPGKPAEFRLIGPHLPENATATATVPAETPMGSDAVGLTVGEQPTNPVAVLVSELPVIEESSAPNNEPATAQEVTVPAAINGVIESEADIDCYAFEAKKGDALAVEVFARRHWSSLDSIVRVLAADGKQLVEQDDGQWFRKTSADSLIRNWTAPADGKYILEIRDLHLRGGEDFVYVLQVETAKPRFDLYLDTDKTPLAPGTSAAIFARVERHNGFTGEVQLQVDGLPPGVTASCGRILAGKPVDGCIILTAAKDAAPGWANITVRGTATHKAADETEQVLETVAVSRQETYMPGGGRSHWQVDLHTVSVGQPADLLAVTATPREITLKPGESVKIEISVERTGGYDKNVTLDFLYRHLSSTFADPLPPGVTIDAKNSKTLLTGKESKGYITLVADEKAEPVEKHQVAAMANISLNFVMKFSYSSEPLFITVLPKAEAETAATETKGGQ